MTKSMFCFEKSSQRFFTIFAEGAGGLYDFL
jgi:hypothetical protein